MNEGRLRKLNYYIRKSSVYTACDSLPCEVINLGIAQPSSSLLHKVNKAKEVAITFLVPPHGEILVSYGYDEMSLTLKPYAEIKETHRRVKAGEEKNKKRCCFFHSDLDMQPVQDASLSFPVC